MCDKVTMSYTCTATESTSRIHKVGDVTLGRAKGRREWKRRVEFESPRRPSCRHKSSAACLKYTSVSSHIGKPNTTSTSATSESYKRVMPSHTKVLQAPLLLTLTKT